MKKRIIPVLTLISGIVLALTPFYLFPVCPVMGNGKHMSCYYSGWLFVILAIVIIIVSIVSIIKPKKWIHYIAFIINLIAVAIAYLAPRRIIAIGNMKLNGWQVGLCKSPEMACHHTTMPVVNTLIVIIGLISIIGIILTFLSEEK